MDVIYKVCCGLDVHKKKLVACLKKKGKKDVIEEFGAETKDIKELAQWLKKNKCEKVAMENDLVKYTKIILPLKLVISILSCFSI